MLRLLSFVVVAGCLLFLAGAGVSQESDLSNPHLDRLQVPPAVATTTAHEAVPVADAIPAATAAPRLRGDRFPPIHPESISLPDPLTKASVLRI